MNRCIEGSALFLINMKKEPPRGLVKASLIDL